MNLSPAGLPAPATIAAAHKKSRRQRGHALWPQAGSAYDVGLVYLSLPSLPPLPIMIIHSRHNWFELLFVWRGSVLPRILPRLCLVFLISMLSAFATNWWISQHAQSSLNIYIFTLMGVSLAIFLSFRNSVSYERYWEARKLWGTLLIVARTLAGKLLAIADARPESRQMLHGICALAYALKGQLRQDDVAAHLQRLLPAEQWQAIADAPGKPGLILLYLHRLNASLRHSGSIDQWQWQSIDRNLDALSDVVGGCERIRSTPIPFTYRVLLNRTVTIYCMLLPIGLTTSIGWLTPMIAVFIAYTYMALDVLGEELEEPFGKEGNDLPLTALCHGIESAVCDMLRLPVPVPAPQPDGVYLY